MPIPKPKAKETYKKFIQRCMDNSTMVKEYPKASQRRAICEGAWKDKKNDAKYTYLIHYLRASGWTPCQIRAEIERCKENGE